MWVNGLGAGYLAEAAARIGVPLLDLSTVYVFDGTLGRPHRENDATAPQTAYGLQRKLRLEYGVVLPDWRASLATCCAH